MCQGLLGCTWLPSSESCYRHRLPMTCWAPQVSVFPLVESFHLTVTAIFSVQSPSSFACSAKTRTSICEGFIINALIFKVAVKNFHALDASRCMIPLQMLYIENVPIEHVPNIWLLYLFTFACQHTEYMYCMGVSDLWWVISRLMQQPYFNELKTSKNAAYK